MDRSAQGTRTRGAGLDRGFRELFYQLRTEGEGADAAAIGVGVFIGCLPVYGLHLALCWIVGRLLGLNRLKMYLAANISNPFVAPFLVFGEVQLGALLRRGRFHPLSVDAVRLVNPWDFGIDLALGSAALGGMLGALFALLTWLAARPAGRDAGFDLLARRASDRYLPAGITAWEFARGKLRGDPIYKTVLTEGLLGAGGTLLDVGCGQGLMLALLAEASRAGTAAAPVPETIASFDALVGIETRPRIAAIARRALGEDATIVEGDARTSAPPRCRAVLFFDVLHMMPAADQESLFGAVAAVLEPGGIILVREADAAAGWRFRAVALGNWLKAAAAGRWSQPFHFRTAAEWTRFFAAHGFDVTTRTAGEGTPFGNVLLVLSSRRGPA